MSVVICSSVQRGILSQQTRPKSSVGRREKRRDTKDSAYWSGWQPWCVVSIWNRFCGPFLHGAEFPMGNGRSEYDGMLSVWSRLVVGRRSLYDSTRNANHYFDGLHGSFYHIFHLYFRNESIASRSGTSSCWPEFFRTIIRRFCRIAFGTCCGPYHLIYAID